jgi:hypothetical protein
VLYLYLQNCVVSTVVIRVSLIRFDSSLLFVCCCVFDWPSTVFTELSRMRLICIRVFDFYYYNLIHSRLPLYVLGSILLVA